MNNIAIERLERIVGALVIQLNVTSDRLAEVEQQVNDQLQEIAGLREENEQLRLESAVSNGHVD